MTRAYNTATTQQNSGGAVAGVTAGKNAVINGGFDIWQRSTSAAFGSGGTYTSADRWATYTGGAGTLSRQVTGDTTNLPFIQYCARMQRNSGSTATNDLTMGNSFETINSIPFAGKTITLSFYARAGANYSGGSNFQAYLRTGTGTDQNYILTGYTGSGGFSNTAITLTTTWQRFTLTGTVASTATEIAVELRWTPSGTAGANDYADVTGVQVEVGSVATPFSRAQGTIAGELAACQRYYYRETPDEQFAAFGSGIMYNSSNGYILWRLPVTMRVKPTLLATSTASNYNVYNVSGSYQALTAAPTASGLSKATITVYCPFPATGGGAGGQTFFMTTDSGLNGYLAASAEL